MFDPLGSLSPIIISAKIMLQNLWLEKVEWDDELSAELNTTWVQFCTDFSNVVDFRIPRHVICINAEEIHLHGFSDISEKAYGACIYIASSNTNETKCHLLYAKTRVAPLKPLTIPKLELCAAHLLAKLITKVIKAVDISLNSYNLWTDSSIVLAWLKTSPMSLKTSVRNRVNEIQTLTAHGDISQEKTIPQIMHQEEPQEINNVFNKLIKVAQRESFSEELLQLLTRNKPLKLKSRLTSLAPFIDDEGFLRVGGRLQNSNLTYYNQHQILLCTCYVISWRCWV